MNMPPMDEPPPGWDQAPPEGGGHATWMRVEDVFHIRGRGTVITGKLEGFGQLKRGDKVHCDGVTWTVSNIEMFAKSMSVAEPGNNVGVLLGGPPGDMLRGAVVGFGPTGVAQGDQQLGPSLGTVVEPKKKRFGRR